MGIVYLVFRHKCGKALMQQRWINKLLRKVAADKVVCGSTTATHAFVVCSSELQRVIEQELFAAFPPQLEVLHAFAAKANPLRGVLGVAHKCGMGCEVASMGELMMAQRVFEPHQIVYDSPVKTWDELRHAVYLPMYLNVDNFEELARIEQLNRERPIVATVGIRINPQIHPGTGQPALRTCGPQSKFGVGLSDNREQIVDAFRRNTFLKMLHVHSGSQGGMDVMVEAAKRIVELAEIIGSQVSVLDIGGGLAVNFASDEITPTVKEYVAALQVGAPSLLSGKYKIITEFGRTLVAKAGVLISRVEYSKVNGDRRIVQQHLGHDLAVRTVWCPDAWPLRVDIFDEAGELKRCTPEEMELHSEKRLLTDVAGPCCLGGDLICTSRPLPQAHALRDFVVVKDVGGYYHSSFSMYNLRQMPPAYLYDEPLDELTQISRGRTMEETLAPLDM